MPLWRVIGRFTQVNVRCRMRYPNRITLPRSSYPLYLQGTEWTRQVADATSKRNTPCNATPRPRLTCLRPIEEECPKHRPPGFMRPAATYINSIRIQKLHTIFGGHVHYSWWFSHMRFANRPTTTVVGPCQKGLNIPTIEQTLVVWYAFRKLKKPILFP